MSQFKTERGKPPRMVWREILVELGKQRGVWLEIIITQVQWVPANCTHGNGGHRAPNSAPQAPTATLRCVDDLFHPRAPDPRVSAAPSSPGIQGNKYPDLSPRLSAARNPLGQSPPRVLRHRSALCRCWCPPSPLIWGADKSPAYAQPAPGSTDHVPQLDMLVSSRQNF